LNEILNSQRSPSDKTRLAYDQDSTSVKQKTDKQPINYVDALRIPLKREDNKEKMVPLKIVPNKHKSTPPTKEKEDKKNIVAKRTPANRYQHIFLRYFYSCNNFGHKRIHCKSYRKYNPKSVQRYK